MATLDALLNPTDGLMNAERPTDGYSYNTFADRGQVDSFTVRSFNFSKGQGGTLTLGSGGGGINGPRYAGSAVDNNAIGNLSWSNPSYATADDAQSATVSFGTYGTSHYLSLTNLEFNIPNDANIQGIQVERKGYFNGSGGGRSAAQLTKGGTVIGTSLFLNMGYPESYGTLGSGTESWGTTLHGSDLNDSTFGVNLWTYLDSGSANATVAVNNIKVTAYYASNSQGVLNLIDGNGGTAIRLDSSGVTIKNNGGTTIIDGNGLNSMNNFPSGNTNGAPTTAFNGTAPVTAANSAMTVSFTRPTNVLITLSLQSASGQTGAGNMSGRTFYTVYYNGTPQQPEILYDSYLDTTTKTTQENVIRKSYSTTMLKTFSAGTGTIDFRYALADISSNCTSTLHKWDLSYIKLGT